MARGKTLTQLLARLRVQSGMSPNINLGVNMVETMKDSLNAEQERLYQDHDWPFLMGHFDVAMAAGQRYYDFPVDPESIIKIEVFWGDQWHDITNAQGISGVQYNQSDSDNDVRLEPVERWGYYEDAAGADDTVDNLQFEVWPMPSTDNQIVRFWGKRAYFPMVDGSDPAMLDDLLICQYSAVDLIKDKVQKQLKLAKADSYYKSLKKRLRKRKVFVLGEYGGEPQQKYRPGPVRVAFPRDSS